ncbi:MAG: sugar phosphate nucleotidyltransferase, partial [Myxococcota bacterium]
ERIWVVTSESLAEATADALPDVPRRNVLAEPTGRNTAPCVGWAADHIVEQDPKGVLAVLPADHHIGDEVEFRRVLEVAFSVAGEHLVTVGVEPTRPETGFGYLELGGELSAGVHHGRRFVEKPDREQAEAFLEAGRFLWNSGMFFFRASAILDEIGTHLPLLREGLSKLAAARAAGRERAVLPEVYPELPSISIDFGVMERAERFAVVPGTFGWSDLGSWQSAWELGRKDTRDNVLPTDTVAIDSARSLVQAPAGKFVALVGVEDIVIVDTGDALLVTRREASQRVREVVDELRRRKRDDLL